jgi:hypothetical protein
MSPHRTGADHIERIPSRPVTRRSSIGFTRRRSEGSTRPRGPRCRVGGFRATARPTSPGLVRPLNELVAVAMTRMVWPTSPTASV